ncbi:MAG: hypothetical protein AMS26_16170 [Bacteroides sp. SM23_62]|nr:MAG: hypothetical protein AMS26_16170 [Bacteroides sp. SM23_62]
MVAALIEKYYLKMLKMKNIVSIGLFATLLLISCLGQEDDDFTALFDGRNLDEWIPGPEGGFEIINGELYTGGEEGNDLFTKKWYCNYVLRLEYMLSDVGNSGVLIRCNPEAAWETGVEVQLLAPWTPWRDDLHCTGSLYGHVAVANRPDETTGIWHKMEIKCDRHTIRVSVDDSMTTLAKIDTVITMADKLICGAIGLQVNHAEKEGQYAKFRNIYIRDLDVEPAYICEGFYETDSVFRAQAYSAALNLGAEMVEPLALMMSGENPLAKSGSKQVLFDMVARATDPQGEEKYKDDVADALNNSADGVSSQIVKEYLEWLSGMIKNSTDE